MNKLKILGIGMTFVLLASLFGFAAVPATAAGPGEQQWDYLTEPYDSEGYKIANGSGPIDFAFNGTQGYLVEYGYGSTKGRLFRSANSGNSWSGKTAIQSVAGFSSATPGFTGVAVAPDDKLSIAVSNNMTVFISNNEGDTVSTLPALPATVDGTNVVITSVAVGPARSGLALPREYAVAVANVGSGNVTGGRVYIVGATYSWTALGTADTRDFLTVAFSPNYIGDRILAAVGANTTAVALQEFKTSDSTQVDIQDVVAGADVGNATTGLAAADIAFPTDFDPTSESTDMMLVGAALTGGTGDVYRVRPTSNTSVARGLSANIASVAYSGTSTSGVLFAGYYASNNVARSDNPISTNPDWTSSTKKPSGTNVKVRLDSSYAFNNTVYALTRSDAYNTSGSASFNVSTDNGVSFLQTSFIKNKTAYSSSSGAANIGAIYDFQITADESHTFYLTNDQGISTNGASTPPALMNGSIHLWDAPGTQPTSTSWTQIFTIAKGSAAGTPTNGTANFTALLGINPAYATTPAIYVVDNSASTASTIYVSKNGGATWSTRTGPSTTRINAILVQDADTIYVAVGSSVYKSTNAGYIWGDARTGSSSPQNMIIAPNSELIMGRNGGIYTSTNAGESNWSSNSLGLNSSTGYYAAVNADYDTNKTYFVAGTDGTVYRRGSADPAWVSVGGTGMAATTYPVAKFGTGDNKNTLYVLTTDGVWRNLNPFDTAASVMTSWEKMNALASSFFYSAAPISGGAMDFQGTLAKMNIYGGYNLIVANLGYNAFSYRDYLAGNAPVLTGPDDGVEVDIDTNTGFGMPVLFTWGQLGTGAGIANTFQLEWKEVGGVTKTSTAFSPSDIGSPSFASDDITGITLRANTSYEWRIRATNEVSGDGVRSAWSAKRTIKVLAGGQVIPDQLGPVLQQITTPSSLRPGFSWTPQPSATKYEFVLATDAGLTQTVAGTPVQVTSPAFGLTADLTPNTTYFWAVRVIEPTAGVQAFGNFTTAPPATTAAPAPTQPPPVITVVVPTQEPAPITVVPPPTTGSIPQALIWVVIVIGAILIIAVLVLIVRTRRPV